MDDLRSPRILDIFLRIQGGSHGITQRYGSPWDHGFRGKVWKPEGNPEVLWLGLEPKLEV